MCCAAWYKYYVLGSTYYVLFSDKAFSDLWKLEGALIMTVDVCISQSEKASSKCLALIFLALKDLHGIVGLLPQSLWILQKEIVWWFAVKIIHVKLMLLIGLLSTLQTRI